MSAPLRVEPRPDYYVPGGTLRSAAPSYVERQADRWLLEHVRNGDFCYVLTPRQMGKSSLMVRTAVRLRAFGIRSVIIDLTELGTKVSAEQWYWGQTSRIITQLGLRTDSEAWWREHSHLGLVQRFVNFLAEVMLDEIPDRVVIFVDEIDTTLNLAFSDDYFAAIRSLFNQRAINDRLDRLTFVLLGVASPSDLIRDATRTPFNIGFRIPVTDFTEAEASVLLPGLSPDLDSATQLMKQVLFWTGGHPFLTQKTCREIAEWAGSSAWDRGMVPRVVDDIVKRLFFSEQGRHQDFNLQFVRDRVLKHAESASLLQLYRRIRGGETVTDDELDPIRAALKLSGLVLAGDDHLLRVRNRIYDRVYDDIWITTELKQRSSTTFRSIFDRFFGRSKPSQYEFDVFVSYSRRDGSWVRDFLIPNLRRAGLTVFFDGSLTPGTEWAKSLDEGLTQSRCILLVLTPDYFASDLTHWEVERALRLVDDPSNKRRVIPILLKNADLPSSLAHIQYVDFTRNNTDMAALDQLLRSLGARGGSSTSGESTAVAQQPYDTGIVRKLLDEALDGDDLDAFIYDYFRPLRDDLGGIQSKKAKIQALIERVDRDGEMDRLLDLMARNHPKEYRRYTDLLQRPAS